MALRRVLPSRATPDSKPESAATATSAPESGAVANADAIRDNAQRNASRRNSGQQSGGSRNAESSASPFGDAALPEPLAGPAEPAPAVNTQSALAAAATSAFSTLPDATASQPARVLEDSFVRPAEVIPAAPEPVIAAPVVEAVPEEPKVEVKPEVKTEEFIAPAWQTPAVAEPVAIAAIIETGPTAETSKADEFVAPAWQTLADPVVAPVVELAPEAPKPEVKAEEFTAPAWQTPAPAPQPEPEPVPVLAASPVMAAPMVAEVTEQPVVPSAPEPVTVVVAPVIETVATSFAPLPSAAQNDGNAEPQISAAPAADVPTDSTPSRPDGNATIKRRVREKRPRDFTAMGAAENTQPERPKPVTAFAPNVPVDTRPINKVDEDLIATGIMAAPPADSLTANIPTNLAETTFTPPPAAPEATFTPAPEPKPEPKIEAPKPFVAPAPEPLQEPVQAPIQLKPLNPTPRPEPVAEPIAAPAAAPISATFNLSSAAAAATLPPPQSDLPWTQTVQAAEWEIETPENHGWNHETGHETGSAAPSHMPPPSDLYKPMGAATSAPIAPSISGGGIPPRSGNNFTPELPGQRRKSAGGAPWALIAVGLLAVAGGGVYMLRQGGNGSAQQQLANLTSPAAKDSAAPTPDGILPPPRTENASFYTPPSAQTAATSTSSSAIVNFADVPPEQANQPIVADNASDKDMPKDMSLFAQLSSEVEKARARKAAGLPADPSASAPTPAAATDTAYTPEKFKEEMAAYRSALAQSPDPAALKPSTFFKDPDGYMDGKTQAQTTSSTDGQMASGALLPPPAGANAGAAIPPAELYTNNPKNLPVVAEPVANAPQRVRTLADFPDIEPYAPEKEKVEIPKNLKPKMAATDFPALEVLSFVPGKGIVAFTDGREGVLLIGESINGWELVSVDPDHAEFKTGQKSYQVTADN